MEEEGAYDIKDGFNKEVGIININNKEGINIDYDIIMQVNKQKVKVDAFMKLSLQNHHIHFFTLDMGDNLGVGKLDSKD